jgi:hypothetical protein
MVSIGYVSWVGPRAVLDMERLKFFALLRDSNSGSSVVQPVTTLTALHGFKDNLEIEVKETRPRKGKINKRTKYVIVTLVPCGKHLCTG